MSRLFEYAVSSSGNQRNVFLPLPDDFYEPVEDMKEYVDAQY